MGLISPPTLISRVTNSVLERVVEWQSRPLEPLYPIVYLDCIVVKVRENNKVINKAIFLALGVNLEGHKALLGMWIAENEGTKFWLNVLTELQNRGLKDIQFGLTSTKAVAADLTKIYQSVTEAEALLNSAYFGEQ